MGIASYGESKLQVPETGPRLKLVNTVLPKLNVVASV